MVLLFCGCQNESKNYSDNTTWWTEEDRQYILSELDRTSEELASEIQSLNDIQWHFREGSDRWSISEIVEHLEMQNQLHYREISVTMNSPQYLEFRKITKDRDDHFTQYATDLSPGTARWFLEPLGRFSTKQEGEHAFFRARNELRTLVERTNIDFRKQFTFRTPVHSVPFDSIKIGQVRDLHQLLLTGVAHTDRHLRQIRNIKLHPEYPD